MEQKYQYQPVNDVVEACADALLTAVAAALYAANEKPPSMGEAMTEARLAIEHIARRTLREGAKAHD